MNKYCLCFLLMIQLPSFSIAQESTFQVEKEKIMWKVHFNSPPEKVYQALNTNEGREGFWAESAIEEDGYIDYVFLNGVRSRGKILERVPSKIFSVMYFDWKVSFVLSRSESGGTDMEMISEGVPEEIKMEVSSGWVSWLMTMKASVDFDVDLRSHDEKRTWFLGYVDN